MPYMSMSEFLFPAISGVIAFSLGYFLYRAKKKSKPELPDGQNSLTNAFLGSKDAVILTDMQGTILSVNPAFTRILGFSPAEVLGKNPRILKTNRHNPDFYKDFWQKLIQTGTWEGQIWNCMASGEEALFHLHVSRQGNLYLGLLNPLPSMSSNSLGLDSINLDPLTHMESRMGFLLRLTHTLEEYDWDTHCMGVVALDIANFKKINSTFGHIAGDSFLEIFSRRLLQFESEQFHFARLGADEFLVEIRQPNPEIQLQPFFDLIAQIVKSPIPLMDESIYVSLFMGIAIAEPELNPDMLVKQADIALHQAKHQKSPYVVFDGKMQRQAMLDLTLSKKLKIAIDNSIIDVYYQPKIDLKTGKIHGMEALARWKDEQGKFIPPGVFIPLAEKNGLINHLFQVIVSKTVKDMAKLFLPVQPTLLVSINLSAHQFEITDLVQEITCRVDHEKVPREAFEFEVTESVFIANMEKTRATLESFKQEGFQLSLDDFGTGFSSLTYLNYLPFDTLKIDKSFVDPVPQDPRMNALTKSIINLSHAINLHCVAEGVENQAQLEFLTDLGCDYCQGYLFSPPVDRGKFLEMLHKQKSSKAMD